MNIKRTEIQAAVTVGALILCSPGFGSDPTPVPKKPTAVVITNENLADYAERGRVTSVGESKDGKKTTASSRPAPNVSWSRQSTADDGAPESAVEAEDKDRMGYWRSKYSGHLRLLEAMEEQIKALDEEIPQLWTEFYSRDDPMYRDGVIKPRLDQALKDRERIEKELTEGQEELSEIMEQARRDGARPSWFRGLKKPTPAESAMSRTRDNDYSVKPTDMSDVSVVDVDDTRDQ